jgi:hypothetical protein
VAVEAGADDRVPVVAVDQVAGAVSATKHLLSLGHRTVWHVSGQPNFIESRPRSRLRRHPRGVVLPAASDHGPSGLNEMRTRSPAAAAQDHRDRRIAATPLQTFQLDHGDGGRSRYFRE